MNKRYIICYECMRGVWWYTLYEKLKMAGYAYLERHETAETARDRLIELTGEQL